MSEQNFHMSPEEFREHGKKLIDWIADYYEHIEDYPVLSQVEPGDIRKKLPQEAPANTQSFFAAKAVFSNATKQTALLFLIPVSISKCFLWRRTHKYF